MNAKNLYREMFADLVGRRGEDIDLAMGALYVAAEDTPAVDIEGATRILDRLAEEAGEGLEPSMDLRAKLSALSYHLGVTQDYRGDRDDYYNPNNVYLDHVLATKRGIPVTLSLIYMEVGYRLGLSLEPIGLPGHLVIRAASQDADIYVDPFHYGRLLSKDECVDLIRDLFGERARPSDDDFQPYSKRQFLVRLLTNLKGMHVRRGDYGKAMAAADRIALIDPRMGSNLKERAWIFQRVGQRRRAIEDLESYLDLYPDAGDKERVRGQIQDLWKTIASLN